MQVLLWMELRYMLTWNTTSLLSYSDGAQRLHYNEIHLYSCMCMLVSVCIVYAYVWTYVCIRIHTVTYYYFTLLFWYCCVLDWHDLPSHFVPFLLYPQQFWYIHYLHVGYTIKSSMHWLIDVYDLIDLLICVSIAIRLCMGDNRR